LLLPPTDISQLMYEVETLRGIPLSQFARFVTGTSSGPMGGDDTYITAQLDASTAAAEAWQVILRSRRELRGEHLVESPEQTLAKLTGAMSRVVSDAYGAGTFALVGGEDLLWSCARGGVAARLALRHSTLFQQAELEYGVSDPKERVLKYGTFWQVMRRELMSQFAKAVSNSPKVYSAQKQSGTNPWRGEALRTLVPRVSSSCARLAALALSGATVLEREAAFATIVSAAMHRMFLSGSSELSSIAPLASTGDDSKEALIEIINFEYLKDLDFETRPGYRDKLELANNPDKRAAANRRGSRQHMDAVWASRRLDTVLSRQITYGKGVDDLVQQLSGLEVEDKDKICTYYVPMGIELENTDAHASVFSTLSSSGRQVWLKELSKACQVLASRLEDGSDATALLPAFRSKQSPGVVVDASMRSSLDRTGVQRHPLVLTAKDGTVFVRLSTIDKEQSIMGGAASAASAASMDFKTAANMLLSRGIDSNVVRERMQRSRTIGYNAERLFFALSLSDTMASRHASASGSGPSIVLSYGESVDRGVEQAFALAIAFALKTSYDGGLVSLSAAYVDEPSDVRTELIRLAQRVDYAVQKGCLVATLSEVVQCM
jgi:hypothetical protein